MDTSSTVKWRSAPCSKPIIFGFVLVCLLIGVILGGGAIGWAKITELQSKVDHLEKVRRMNEGYECASPVQCIVEP